MNQLYSISVEFYGTLQTNEFLLDINIQFLLWLLCVKHMVTQCYAARQGKHPHSDQDGQRLH